MSIAPDPTVVLGHRFAAELPELAVQWRAAAAPDPRLLVLNESLAADVRLDPEWLRSPDGIGLLVGTQVLAGAQPVAQGMPVTSSAVGCPAWATAAPCFSAN